MTDDDLLKYAEKCLNEQWEQLTKETIENLIVFGSGTVASNIIFNTSGTIQKRQGAQQAMYLKSGAALDYERKTEIVESLLQQGLISQEDMKTLLMCDSFKQHIVEPADVVRWLYQNKFKYDLMCATFTKLASSTTTFGLTVACQITDEEIFEDAQRVINEVTQWHVAHYIKDFMKWDDWHDPGDTRKIDLGTNKQDWCAHEWVDYIGLNEKFTYCKKCDKKKEPK